MPRRVGLPGAAELFRATTSADAGPQPPAPEPPEPATPKEPKPTGRVRHEEKITVYVSSDELLAIALSLKVAAVATLLALVMGTMACLLYTSRCV